MDKLIKKRLKEFQKIIGYSFSDRELLLKALTHKSYMNENPTMVHFNNQRLEFLGDAVLDLIISHFLMSKFLTKPEGELSKIRAFLVNEDQLSLLAIKLEIGKYIFLGKGEELSGGKEKSSILADCYEAIVGAVFLDRGFKKCNKLILKHFDALLKNLSTDEGQTALRFDFKTRLQEYSQNYKRVIPKYIIKSEAGPEHQKTFEVEVFIGKISYGTASGKSKKEAEQSAAKQALDKITLEKSHGI